MNDVESVRTSSISTGVTSDSKNWTDFEAVRDAIFYFPDDVERQVAYVTGGLL